MKLSETEKNVPHRVLVYTVVWFVGLVFYISNVIKQTREKQTFKLT